MPTPTKGPRLGGGPAHERLMLANLATSLFEHDRITTTEAKAKRLRPLAERLITFAKRGDLHARRQVMTVIRDKDVVHKLFAEIGPKFATAPGGYTRIVKTGPRKGDNAPMAIIELVEELNGGQSRCVRPSGRAAPGRARKAPSADGGDRRGRRRRSRQPRPPSRPGRARRASGASRGRGRRRPKARRSPRTDPLRKASPSGNADSKLYHVPDSRFEVADADPAGAVASAPDVRPSDEAGASDEATANDADTAKDADK